MKSFKFGQSNFGQAIMAHSFGNKGPKVLILGGVHGNEWEGALCAQSLLNHFIEAFTYDLQLTIVPHFNPDGLSTLQRKNANSVDLNRNLPSKDWTNEVAEEKYYPGKIACSEPENKALVKWLDDEQPKLVISLHSWKPMLNVNGNCSPEAEIISEKTGYEIHESIGYPTPGCLGTYCGLERNMPTLTYELQRDMKAEDIVNIHIPAILEALKSAEQR
ncbi:MAG: DUF2817 domain-containing protein [Bdellovibrionaceae bacterium]|jgi:murein peptide amidase A|nr:DUF2817 domain-containing protein [Pseudobdellovibrionaceae bacterium]